MKYINLYYNKFNNIFYINKKINLKDKKIIK